MGTHTFRLTPPQHTTRVADLYAHRLLLSATASRVVCHHGRKQGDYHTGEMARLRVPASPIKARPVKSKYAAVNKKTIDHQDPQSKDKTAHHQPSQLLPQLVLRSSFRFFILWLVSGGDYRTPVPLLLNYHRSKAKLV